MDLTLQSNRAAVRPSCPRTACDGSHRDLEQKMTPSRTTLRAAIGTVSAAVLATTVLTGAPAHAEAAAPESAPATAASAASSSVRFVDIEGDGGVTLKANVFTPAGADGTRRYPVIVLPPAGRCRRSSTWRRPRSCPKRAMWSSDTTRAGSGSPAGRSRRPVRRTSPMPRRSSTGRWPTRRPIRRRSAWAGSRTVPGSACWRPLSTSGSRQLRRSAAGATSSARSTADVPSICRRRRCSVARVS